MLFCSFGLWYSYLTTSMQYHSYTDGIGVFKLFRKYCETTWFFNNMPNKWLLSINKLIKFYVALHLYQYVLSIYTSYLKAINRFLINMKSKGWNVYLPIIRNVLKHPEYPLPVIHITILGKSRCFLFLLIHW